MSDVKPADEDRDSEIAIIGMSGRFPGCPAPGSCEPGAATLDAFWQNLEQGVESLSTFTADELTAAGVPADLRDDPHYVPVRAILEDVEYFDAAFFGFSPREAELMDPQYRLFLECAWEALEAAGYAPTRFAGPIGVFAGSGENGYHLRPAGGSAGSATAFQADVANGKDYLPTWVSYKLNLTGPSVCVQTACSTSLVAVHLACQSLLSGECDIALAGGVSISIPQKVGHLHFEGSVLAPDGHCRAFDAAAQGTASGDGLGIVVLKRLAEALADGDLVHAVIKGSAINNDGAGKVGFTAPSVDGQAAVIAEAQAVAGVDPETIRYVEAHGTGTPMGDPVEIAALTQAFATERRGYCAIGSLKTNLGHLDAAAGVAGLIKTVLALEHRQLPPSLNFTAPNPEIDFATSPFYVNTRLQPWPRGETPRRAAVSSFGIGGTNAHAVVEEAPPPVPSGPSRPAQLLVLSARTASALETAAGHLAACLRQGPADRALADVAYTLMIGRESFEHRRTVVAATPREAATALETGDPRRVRGRIHKSGPRPVVFMFPGQGVQYVNMGLGPYEHEPTFRTAVDRCCELLAPHLGCDLRRWLFPSADEQSAAAERLAETEYGNPAMFVVGYALARLWMEWGIRPELMIGHSCGEYVAACLAGVFELADALRVVTRRARLVQGLPPGAMLSVPLPAAELPPLAERGLSLAASNAPSLCLVSGPPPAVAAFAEELTAAGIECRRVALGQAGHSAMMEPILEPFAAEMATVALREPAIPFISNVTGRPIRGAEATDPAYWVRHLRATVRFGEGLATVLEKKNRILLEVGPGRSLAAAARQQPAIRSAAAVVSSLPRREDLPEGEAQEVAVGHESWLLETLGRLWLAGATVDWPALYAHERRSRVRLPTYPFERRRFWREPAGSAGFQPARGQSPRQAVQDWTYLPSWRRTGPPSLLPRPEPAERRRWLVFADRVGLGEAIAERLAQGGDRVITVAAGDGFAGPQDDRYLLDPAAGADYDALLTALEERDLVPDRIVDLRSVTAEADAEPAPGCFSLLLLAQAWARREWDHPLRLAVVATGLWEVTGEEALIPAHATLLGPVRVLPQEVPGGECRLIDVVLDQSRPHGGLAPGSHGGLAPTLLAELIARGADCEVALRGRHRWVPCFERVRLDPDRGRARLRPQGVYLITGGLGGLGLVLAQHLAAAVRARLILVGRSAFPAPDEWPQWLADHDGDEVSRKIRKLQALEELGAEILVARADVTDGEAMADLVRRSRERFGRIDGVVHAAGIVRGGMMALKTPEEMTEVLAPKVAGTRVLEAIFKPARLDFFVLFSSLNSLTGGIGHVDHCAANAFLDAFAHANGLDRETHTVAINWDAWREVGGAADAARGGQPWLKLSDDAIAPAEGIEVFLQALGAGVPQVVVSTTDLDALLRRERSLGVSHRLAELEDQRLARSGHPRPELDTPFVAPRNALESRLAALWGEMLGIDQVGVHDDFFELGGHSLLAIQILSRLRSRHQIHLAVERFFLAGTVAELARAVDAAGRENPAGTAPAADLGDFEDGRV